MTEIKKLMMWFALGAGLCLFLPAQHLFAKKPKGSFTKEEKLLAKPKKVKFRDRRLKKIYAHMRKQYEHIYSYASADGYIFPNERRELYFHLRLMNRIVTIDKRSKKVDRIYNRLARKKRRYQKKNRWRKRRKKPLLSLDEADKALLKNALQHKTRYEKMIRRFSCRYIKNYSKKHKGHCKTSHSTD